MENKGKNIEYSSWKKQSRNKRTLGGAYEKLACEFLTAHGYQIVECNFRNRFGEIDVIAKDKEYICFIEVKFRQGNACGRGLEAVDARKQHTITKVAQYYLVTHGYNEYTPARFDVIAIDGNQISLIPNAFEAI